MLSRAACSTAPHHGARASKDIYIFRRVRSSTITQSLSLLSTMIFSSSFFPCLALILSLFTRCCVALSASSNSASSTNNKNLPPSLIRTSSSHQQQALSSLPPFPRTWVPLASVYELDGNRPNKVEFLGQSYVCFQSSEDTWSLVDDACPHRLAPLSEGRIIAAVNTTTTEPSSSSSSSITSKQIECAYHGWAFDARGQCVRIPQASEELQRRTISSNSNCHVQSYSTRICKNILFAWLWPEDCLAYLGDDWRQPEYMVSNIQEDTSTYTRDLPYGWDTLLENIVDPSHVPWAHHGLQGSREDAIVINMTTPTKLTEQGMEFSFEDRTMKMYRAGRGVFRAPFVISYDGDFTRTIPKKGSLKGPHFNLTTIMLPTKPGWSRIIIYGGPAAATKKKKEETKSLAAFPSTTAADKPVATREPPNLLFRLLRAFPVWILHQFSHKFLDSDLALLHYQEQERFNKRKLDYDGYCMPAPADRCIVAMRKWIQTYAFIPTTMVEGKASLPSSPMDKRVLFNRWAQHTDQCKHCHAAKDGIQKWRRNTYLAMAASILLLPKFLLARVVAVACIALLRLLSTAENSMVQGGFDHYKNN